MGSGTEGDPYLIEDANDMQAIGADPNYWDAHFKLVNDVNLAAYTSTEFNIIGIDWDNGWDNTFTGVFDGNGHTISNFTYNSTGTDNIGIFGYIGGNAVIKDLGLVEPNVEAGTGDYVGSLIGRGSGVVTDCYVQGGHVSGTYWVGGLIGSGCDLTDCYATCDVSGRADLGGLVGGGGRIADCYATGNVSAVTGTMKLVGGLVGTGGIIVSSYSTGNVSGKDWVGGLAGHCSKAISNCSSSATVTGSGECIGGLVGIVDWGQITDSSATGSVSGGNKVGGLVGVNGAGAVDNCYSTGNVSGSSNVGGLVGSRQYPSYPDGTTTDSFWDTQTSGRSWSDGGTGKTTAEMEDPNTFINAGWAFASEPNIGPNYYWVAPAGGGYMVLWWQLLEELPELPSFSGGSGEVNDPYWVSTAAELNGIGHNPRLMKAHFKLTNNIDLTGVDFLIIGNEFFPFRGTFDGNDFEISNLTYAFAGTKINCLGLFGYVSDINAEIRDLWLVDPNVDGGTGAYVGSLVGRLRRGIVAGCHTSGTANIAGDMRVGGLVGGNDYGTISNCYFEGIVTGVSNYIGGLVGGNYGIVSECNSIASVLGTNYVGGLVGLSYFGGMVADCSSAGSVIGNSKVGGSVGCNGEWGTLVNCSSSDSVEGDDRVGGLVGFNSGIISKCYSTSSNVTGDNTYVAGLVGMNTEIVEDSYFVGTVTGNSTYVGGLVGENRANGLISNSYSAGSINGNDLVGGLVGKNDGVTVSNCFSFAFVNGDGYVGGLVGGNYNNGTASRCYSVGTVVGNDHVGGLLGMNSGWVIDSYATGSVYGTTEVGGLVGWNHVTISNCYSAGSVNGSFGVGGLVGIKSAGATTSNSFWDTQTSGQASSAGGTGKTTAEMQQMTTFTDPPASWDFLWESVNGDEDIWTICEGVDYPKLTWQFTIGDFDDDDDVDFNDFALFAIHWLGSDSIFPCGGTDLTGDGKVGLDDLAELTEHWLEGTTP